MCLCDVLNKASGEQPMFTHGGGPRVASPRPEESEDIVTVTSHVPRHFMLSTLFLEECYDYLMIGEEESSAYLSGFVLDGLFIIDLLIKYVMDVQEIALVKGNLMSTTSELIRLSDLGFRMLGTIHCHPGRGRFAACPSPLDIRQQSLLEQGGYTPLGVIMTRDRYVNFYTCHMPFVVTVIGSNAKKVAENCYWLDQRRKKKRVENCVAMEQERPETNMVRREDKNDDAQRAIGTGTEQVCPPDGSTYACRA